MNTYIYKILTKGFTMWTPCDENSLPEIIAKAKALGHTHAQVMARGHCASYRPIDDLRIQSGLFGVVTGYPVYANYNRFAYDPEVVDISDKPEKDLSMMRFMNT